MKILLLTISLLSCLLSSAQNSLDYYLPAEVVYDVSIPTPKSVIGHEVGDWHVSHDKLTSYMYAIADASDRITIREYARTFENRPLLVLTITSPENQKNIETIRKEHLKLSNSKESNSIDINSAPAVLYMGYSVHGNEPSGSNASMLVAYHLAAAQGDEIDKMLQNTVFLLDPSYNPDGLNRFASWVNSHKSKNLVTDPNNLEQNEAWPRGRTNHYWFDLNRDWLPVQMPESRGRIKTFHDWKPNVLTDHHEMGTNSTYFFQPGVPSRNHPLTPKNNFILTEKIAQYHAKALDNIGSFYYSQESFDDFYYGKGSTFPDVNGGIGILFEQASSRGHAQQSVNGIITFPFTIKNHFTTSLSTIKAVTELKSELLTLQRDFYKQAVNDALKDPIKAYVFGEETDKTRTNELIKIFEQHRIDCFVNTKKTNKNGNQFVSNESFIVPLDQQQYKLIKAMFEKRTSFSDSLFYDVSAWTLPLAFNIKYAELSSKEYNSTMLGENSLLLKDSKGQLIGEKSKVGYAFKWNDYNAPLALNKFQTKGIKTKVALEPFTNSEGKEFGRGSILIPVGQNNPDMLFNLGKAIALESGIDIYSLKSGYTSGINLGSPNIVSLKKPKALIIVEGGVSSYDVGEVWHLLDQRVNYALSQVSINKFNKIDLSKYNTLIMVNGNYGELNLEKLKIWIQNGGNVIAMKKAAQWLSKNELSKVKFKSNKADSTRKNLPYNLKSKYKGAQVIGGAIFETKLDLTHPIGFGFSRPTMSVFRNSTLFMEQLKDPYANPLVYTSNPLQAGYISKENNQKLKNTSAVSITKFGKGKIISFSDNPNFRAFWYGTNKLFLNSLFFGSIIK